MAKSDRSTVLMANAIAWLGVVVAALIGIYGPHGPARHPEMLAPSALLVAIILLYMLSGKISKKVLTAQIVLWTIALIAGLLITGTDLGEGVHPLATPAVYLVGGVIATLIFATAKFLDGGATTLASER